jgi:hypothetical protein
VRCALCFWPIEDVTAREANCLEHDICATCRANQVDRVIDSCEHAVCGMCADVWFTDQEECPFCRRRGGGSRPFVSYGEW